MLRDTIKDKALQWVATKDIGRFAAKVFYTPETWDHKAAGLTEDELTFSGLDLAFQKVTGHPVPTNIGLMRKALKHGVSEMGEMVERFFKEAYGVDLGENKQAMPNMTAMEEWLKESAFMKQK